MQTGAPSLAASKSYENKRRSKPRLDPYLFYKILPLLLSIKLANPDVREKQQIIIHTYRAVPQQGIERSQRAIILMRRTKSTAREGSH